MIQFVENGNYLNRPNLPSNYGSQVPSVDVFSNERLGDRISSNIPGLSWVVFFNNIRVAQGYIHGIVSYERIREKLIIYPTNDQTIILDFGNDTIAQQQLLRLISIINGNTVV
jgi:hypothetical protein